jgi:DNA-binding IclR family transcriptional regulator
MDRQKPRETLSTIERGFEVVRTLREMGGARVTELAEELDMAPSTAHKYLATLAKERYVVKEGDEYHVGLEFLDLGTYVKNRKKGYRLSIPKVREIAEETGERAQFVVEEYGRGIYVHTEASDARAVLTDRRAGVHRYLHSSAAGKAILANLPDYRVDEIIDEHGLPAETDQTITDRDELFEELAEISETNVAYNNEESVEGLRAVGVPIQGPEGLVLGSLSVSGPSNRLKGPLYTEEIPDLLLGHANEIELNIRYS